MTPPDPEVIVQRPEPIRGALPSRLVEPQTVLSGPASAVVGADSSSTTTSSVVDPQEFVTVQRSVYVVPATPVNCVAGSDGSAKLPPAPVTTLHAPVPIVRSEEHTSELQSRENLVCRLLLDK